MVKIGVLLMVLRETLYVLIPMPRNHLIIMLFVMVIHLTKHCKDFMIGV